MYIADLHIHSRFSRATSKDGDLPHLDWWARRKGIRMVGTGDFTHPAWRAELREQLVPAGEGVYTLRQDLRLPDVAPGEAPRFVITGEISCIYKRHGRTRKVHNLILLPSLEAADELSARLEAIGNIHSDGRPILGLDSRDLLELTLDTCPDAEFIPAHIWTPHFALFGAFSGFDTMEECFGDLTGHIHAVETGLSSDPPMNWRVSALDGLTLVSHSDAHSPSKLGREADLLDTGLTYPELVRAIRTGEGCGRSDPRSTPPWYRSRRGIPGHGGVLPRGGQVPPGWPPELRRLPGPGGDSGAGRRLPRLREETDHRRGAPGGGPGGPSCRVSSRGCQTL